MNRDFFYIALLICVAPPLVVLTGALLSMVAQ
jgi:hypothetical protein